MIALEHILVPTDFSEASEAAVKYGSLSRGRSTRGSIYYTSRGGTISR